MSTPWTCFGNSPLCTPTSNGCGVCRPLQRPTMKNILQQFPQHHVHPMIRSRWMTADCPYSDDEKNRRQPQPVPRGKYRLSSPSFSVVLHAYMETLKILDAGRPNHLFELYPQKGRHVSFDRILSPIHLHQGADRHAERWVLFVDSGHGYLRKSAHANIQSLVMCGGLLRDDVFNE